ncbi:MAG TPA: gamma-glutamyltransferase family protein [Armatimonadota bacterium]|nr:gamma-glutamyltransferase family protein [Armatimonadota bacterium]
MGFTTRPVIMGTHGAVAAGHYLAARAGLRMLEVGGNAIDAGVAMGFALALLKPDQNGIGGESPILIYAADRARVSAVNGQGFAPEAATMARMKELGIEDIIPGDGFLPAMVPSMVDNYVTSLAVFGTLPLAEVLAPALEMAEHGFPLHEGLRGSIQSNLERWQEHYPSTVEVWAPGGRVPEIGQVVTNRDWAAAMGLLVEAERKAARRGRRAALEAARDVFYKGEIAKTIVTFARETEVIDASGRAHAGLLAEADFAAFRARVEDPIGTSYRGLMVYKCNTWCQGAVFLQQLNLLEGFDLAAMEHNGPDYIHTVIECAKLAFADRNAHYGDPEFAEVPLGRLLSKEYAEERRRLVDAQQASREDRPGDVPPGRRREPAAPEGEWPLTHTGDTTRCCAVDRWGNMISITPSGGWFMSSPVVPGLGFPLGTRGQMFELDPEHPNCLQPRKRPRTTLTPSLVMKEGKPWMVFGTPGGDSQDQWTLQFFLNYVDFGMNLQEAVDKPTFHSEHFRGSFHPRAAKPGSVVVEGRIPEGVRKALEARGHVVRAAGDWAHGQVEGIRYDAETGLISAASSPRGVSYAMGW